MSDPSPVARLPPLPGAIQPLRVQTQQEISLQTQELAADPGSCARMATCWLCGSATAPLRRCQQPSHCLALQVSGTDSGRAE